MSMDAVALLPISIDAMSKSMRIEHEDGDTIHFRVVGRTLQATPIEGGVCVALDMRFDTPTTTLGTLIRRDFGDALGELDRAFVYPSVAKPQATDYEGLLSELGEGGEWVNIPAEDQQVSPSDAAGVFQGLAAGLGPDMLGQMQKVMSDPGAMGQLAQLAQGLMADDDMRAMFENVAQQMQSGDGDLLGSAREMAEKASRENPELLNKIGAQLGVAPAPASQEQNEGESEGAESDEGAAGEDADDA